MNHIFCDGRAIVEEKYDMSESKENTEGIRKIDISCRDKNEAFCGSYVRNYGNRFCDQDWFISDFGRYGCKLSCKLCTVERSCEDKDESFCASYVRVYGQRYCNSNWFISDMG